MPKKKALSLEPVTWKIYEDNVKIMDIPADKIDQACDFMIEHTKVLYAIFRDIEIERIAVDFRIFIETILCEGSSMMLFNEERNEIMGATLLLPMLTLYKTWTALEVTSNSEIIQTYIRLLRYILGEGFKDDIMTDSVHIFTLILNDEYCGKGYKVDLITCAEKLASSMHIPRVTFISYTANNQQRAIRAGMTEKYRVYFATYCDPKTKEQPFQVAGKAEWYTILYVKEVIESKRYTDY